MIKQYRLKLKHETLGKPAHLCISLVSVIPGNAPVNNLILLNWLTRHTPFRETAALTYGYMKELGLDR